MKSGKFNENHLIIKFLQRSPWHGEALPREAKQYDELISVRALGIDGVVLHRIPPKADRVSQYHQDWEESELMTDWDMARYISSLRRVRSLFTTLCDGNDASHEQRVVYLRYLKILDEKIASVEMQVSLSGFVKEVRLALL